jgi:uncharacterized protein YkwD
VRRFSRLLLLLVAALAATLVPAAGASAAKCPGARVQPADANRAKIRKATLCLLNQKRADAGLGRIRGDGRLNVAATGHSEDMVRSGYFDHSSPSGETLVSRVSEVGYIKATASWFLAENIAWGSGSLSTPASIVRQWMRSPPHRANILNPRVRDAGLGVALGTPGGGQGATYTLDFGRTG